MGLTLSLKGNGNSSQAKMEFAVRAGCGPRYCVTKGRGGAGRGGAGRGVAGRGGAGRGGAGRGETIAMCGAACGLRFSARPGL